MTFAQRFTRIVDRFYILPVRRIMPLGMFRYAACGVANLILSWLLYFTVYNFILRQQNVYLELYTLSGHVAALVIVFPITFLTGFWLQRHIAFKASPLRGHVQLFRYLLSIAGSLLLNTMMLKLFVDVFGFFATPSYVAVSLLIAIYSYFMQKHFTFRHSQPE